MIEAKQPRSRVEPTRHVSNPKFKYINAASTDIKRTFRKARLLMRLSGGAVYESRT